MAPNTFNFSAGPALLPKEVLLEAQKGLVDYEGTGMSVMEMSHRSANYDKVHRHCIDLIREVLEIPTNYHVLLLAGGATYQFSAIPFNLLGDGNAVYVNTGAWSKKASTEAKRLFPEQVKVVTSPTFTLPKVEDIEIPENCKYVYICDNETVHGVEWPSAPVFGDVPLVADMSSNLFSRKLDIAKYGMIYACAQKNFGPAGLTVAIIREDLVGEAHPMCPVLMTYKTHVAKTWPADLNQDGLYNTPPTLCIWITMLVMEWIQRCGGIEGIEKMNRDKAAMLYNYIDASPFWTTFVEGEIRSQMNVVFKSTKADVDRADILAFFQERGMSSLKGHKSLAGSLRASIYNAMPVEGVTTLIQAMKDFEATH